tara:strand:+ start:74 stop:829 length:756 start_codon:yes stop_codon:yes gene_type:complete
MAISDTLKDMRDMEKYKMLAQLTGGVPASSAGQTPMPSQGVGPAALGGMSQEQLMQGFAQEAAAMQQPVSPTIPPTAEIKQNLNEVLTATLPDGDSLAIKGLEDLTKRAGIDVESKEPIPSQGLPIAAAPAMLAALQNPARAAQSGGLMRLAAGGGFVGQVPGEGHGMQDNVYMPIVERQEGQRVGTLAVSPDEYVVDAHTMSALGNGSADAGADVMDNVVKNVRQKAYGTMQQPNQINGLSALRPMMERV